MVLRVSVCLDEQLVLACVVCVGISVLLFILLLCCVCCHHCACCRKLSCCCCSRRARAAASARKYRVVLNEQNMPEELPMMTSALSDED